MKYDLTFQSLLEEFDYDKKNLPNMKLIGKFIDFGAYGFAFNYGKNKVIKLVLTPDNYYCQNWNKFSKVAAWLKHRKPKNVVKFYNWNVFNPKRKKSPYWYVCEKLKKPKDWFEDSLYYTGKSLNIYKHFRHTDPANCMLDKNGNYKLMDLDSFKFVK